MVRLISMTLLTMNFSTSPRVAASSPHNNNDSLRRTQGTAARLRSMGVVLAAALVCPIVLLPLTSSAQTTWNNSGTEWTSGTSWVGGVAPASSVGSTNNTAVFSNVAVGFNAVNLSSDRSIYGVLFTAGANAYTFTGNALTVGSGGGISNASASLQTFSNRVINNGANPVYGSYAGGSLLFAGGIDLTTPTSTASRTLFLAGSGDITVSGSITTGGASVTNTSGGNISVSNTSLTIFSGNNTYFGTTTVSSGSTLRLGSATALGATNGGTEIKSGGALDLNGQTIGAEGLTITGTGVSSNGAIFNSSASAATWSGNITPSSSSTIKATSGSITLSGGIDLNNSAASSRTLTLDGTGEIIVSGNISNSFAGSTGSLTKTGSGTVTLSGANTYSGTTKISAGTILLSGTSALSTNGVIAGSSSAADNSTLQLAGGGNYVLSAFGSTNDNGNNIIFTNSSGSAATLTFTAATNYVTRSSDNSGGRTVANQSTNLGLVFNGAVDIGSSTINNVTFGGAGNTTVKGVIFNTNTAVVRGLTKTGTGTLSLEGANSYNGPTTVSAGSLIVASTGSLSSSAVSISNGATFRYNGSSSLASSITVGGGGSGRAVLGGTGTINSAVALNSLNDVLSPGNSPGIQSFTPNQTWSSFTYDWELNNFTGTTAGTAFDQISIAGSLDLLPTSSYTLNVISLTAGNVAGDVPNFTEVDTSWIILTASGGISGFDSGDWLVDTNSFSALGSIAGRFTISQSGNNLNLNYVVPEPSTYALLGVSALACSAWFVRRRRKS